MVGLATAVAIFSIAVDSTVVFSLDWILASELVCFVGEIRGVIFG